MFDEAAVPKRSWFSTFSRRWRLYVVLALSFALPLLLFLSAGHWLIRKLTIASLLSQSGQAADIAGKVVEDRLEEGRLAVQSFAADPLMVDAWKRGEMERLASRLREAHDLTRQVSFWGIYDSKGYLRVGYPAPSEAITKSFASSDWFRGAIETRNVRISSGSLTADAPTGFVITVAAPLDCAQCGVVATTYTPQTVKSWLAPMRLGATKWISVVDHNGIVVVAPDRDPSAFLSDVSKHESVRKAIAGQSGTEFVSQDGQRVLVSRHPLSTLGWAVLVEIPLSEIDKALWVSERPLGLLGLVFAVIALLIGTTIAVLYRQLRESREHVQQILATSHDAFVGMDEHGVITEWNQQADALFGYSAADALGRPFDSTIVPHRYREDFVSGLRRFLSTGKARMVNNRQEMSALHRSGREFPIEFSISHVSTFGKNSFNAFIRDISERKRAQEEIANLNTDLLREVSELEARNKELEAFNYSVSHDVGAPLRHIVSFSRLLAEECAQQVTAAGREYLDVIVNSALRLQQLVSDLLRFSRLGAQGLDVYPTDLAAVVKDVISELQPDLQSRKVKFEVSALPTIECDGGLIKQVYWNLIANAIKFTSTRENAIIEIGKRQRDGVNIFFVRDNGVGFNMNNAEKLFAPFQRLHSQNEFPGSGVGLAVVQLIISKHNGQIWAESEPNQGATFFFTLGDPSTIGAPPHVGETHRDHESVSKV
jgi:PAS domain S-box-containing protein